MEQLQTTTYIIVAVAVCIILYVLAVYGASKQ